MEVWHPTVEAFTVSDSAGIYDVIWGILPFILHGVNSSCYMTHTGKECGLFYLDPYSRIGEKYGGSWVESGRDKSCMFNGLPLAYINMNLTPTIGKQPTLMSVKHVAELFSSVR